MKRLLPLIAPAAFLLSAFTCSSGPKRPPPPSPAEQMARITERIGELEADLDELQSNISRFDHDNWRDVVPNVRSSAEELAATLEGLSSGAEDLERELRQAEGGDYGHEDYDPR